MKERLYRLWAGIIRLQKKPMVRLAVLVLLVVAIGVLCFDFVTFAATPVRTTGTTASQSSISVTDRLALLAAGIGLYIAAAIGQIVVALMTVIIIPLMQYNSFATSPVIGAGWAIIRDTVNMFFVIILIVIAMGTIFGAQRFNWQRQVTKLMLFAIVINFSRLICGLMIDVAQVIMMTFAYALKDIAGGNFVQLFGLSSIMTVDPNSDPVTAAWNGTSTDGIKAFDIMSAAFAANLMMIAVFVCLLFLAIILAYRIVMLWVLVTLAPLAWFFGGVGDLVKSSAYSSWWKNFTCYTVIGPVVTFFLWLTLAVAGAGTIGATFDQPKEPGSAGGGILQGMDTMQLTSFIIGIAMMFAGFQAAQEVCQGAQGAIGGLTQSMAKYGGGAVAAPINITRGAGRLGARGVRGAARLGKRAVGGAVGLAVAPIKYGGKWAMKQATAYGGAVVREQLGGAGASGLGWIAKGVAAVGGTGAVSVGAQKLLKRGEAVAEGVSREGLKARKKMTPELVGKTAKKGAMEQLGMGNAEDALDGDIREAAIRHQEAVQGKKKDEILNDPEAAIRAIVIEFGGKKLDELERRDPDKADNVVAAMPVLKNVYNEDGSFRENTAVAEIDSIDDVRKMKPVNFDDANVFDHVRSNPKITIEYNIRQPDGTVKTDHLTLDEAHEKHALSGTDERNYKRGLAAERKREDLRVGKIDVAGLGEADLEKKMFGDLMTHGTPGQIQTIAANAPIRDALLSKTKDVDAAIGINPSQEERLKARGNLATALGGGPAGLMQAYGVNADGSFASARHREDYVAAARNNPELIARMPVSEHLTSDLAVASGSAITVRQINDKASAYEAAPAGSEERKRLAVELEDLSAAIDTTAASLLALDGAKMGKGEKKEHNAELDRVRHLQEVAEFNTRDMPAMPDSEKASIRAARAAEPIAAPGEKPAAQPAPLRPEERQPIEFEFPEDLKISASLDAKDITALNGAVAGLGAQAQTYKNLMEQISARMAQHDAAKTTQGQEAVAAEIRKLQTLALTQVEQMRTSLQRRKRE